MREKAGDPNVQGEWFFTKQERKPTQQTATAMMVRPPMPAQDGPSRRVNYRPGFIAPASPQTRKPGQPSLPGTPMVTRRPIDTDFANVAWPSPVAGKRVRRNYKK